VLFKKYGADATRWYLVTNSPPWRATLFDEEGLAEVQRKFFGTLLNTYQFFALYANIDNFTFKEELIPYEQRPELDRWVISRLNSLVEEYEEYMENYDVTRAARAVSGFTIDHLSNWYVRRSRRKFWKSEMNETKLSAYQTLYECLVKVAKLTSPIAPFISEELYINLNKVTKKENFDSVHLSFYPESSYRDKELEEKMEIAQRVVYITRAMRAKANLKVRQPLRKIMVAVDKSKTEALSKMKEVILEEVNIKELVVLKDDSEIVNKSARPNFKSIGPKFGKNVNAAANAIKSFTKEDITKLERGENVYVQVKDEKLLIGRDDVEIVSNEISGWVVESEEGVTVAIDTALDEKLIREGLAREFVNRIQNMRKDAGFQVTDRIAVKYSGSKGLISAIDEFSKYIANETLAEKMINEEIVDGGIKQNWRIGEFDCSIQIEKLKS
jgi:isoleucyl-tRNA synthetase